MNPTHPPSSQNTDADADLARTTAHLLHTSRYIWHFNLMVCHQPMAFITKPRSLLGGFGGIAHSFDIVFPCPHSIRCTVIGRDCSGSFDFKSFRQRTDTTQIAPNLYGHAFNARAMFGVYAFVLYFLWAHSSACVDALNSTFHLN